jgi:hypothetical protein
MDSSDKDLLDTLNVEVLCYAKVHTAAGEIKAVTKRVKNLEMDVKKLKDKQ